MHGKVIWKPRIAEIVKAPRDVAPESLKGKGGGLTVHPWTPSCKGQHVDARCVMTYSHKTQSFMKNGDQQKCLSKALIMYMFWLSYQSFSILYDVFFAKNGHFQLYQLCNATLSKSFSFFQKTQLILVPYGSAPALILSSWFPEKKPKKVEVEKRKWAVKNAWFTRLSFK